MTKLADMAQSKLPACIHRSDVWGMWEDNPKLAVALSPLTL